MEKNNEIIKDFIFKFIRIAVTDDCYVYVLCCAKNDIDFLFIFCDNKKILPFVESLQDEISSYTLENIKSLYIIGERNDITGIDKIFKDPGFILFDCSSMETNLPRYRRSRNIFINPFGKGRTIRHVILERYGYETISYTIMLGEFVRKFYKDFL